MNRCPARISVAGSPVRAILASFRAPTASVAVTLAAAITAPALVTLAAIAAHSPAQAQAPRQFPPTALRGTLVITQPPEATLDGKPARLAPGARIRDQRNLGALSGTLTGQTLTVNYTRDALGQLRDIWVLTAEEAKVKRPRLSDLQTSAGYNTDASGAATSGSNR